MINTFNDFCPLMNIICIFSEHVLGSNGLIFASLPYLITGILFVYCLA